MTNRINEIESVAAELGYTESMDCSALDYIIETASASVMVNQKNVDLVAQVEDLSAKNFELTCYRIDVLRCLKTIAFEHNHEDIIRYQPLARRLMDSLAENKELNNIKADAIDAAFDFEDNRWCETCSDRIDMILDYAKKVRAGEL